MFKFAHLFTAATCFEYRAKYVCISIFCSAVTFLPHCPDDKKWCKHNMTVQFNYQYRKTTSLLLFIAPVVSMVIYL